MQSLPALLMTAPKTIRATFRCAVGLPSPTEPTISISDVTSIDGTHSCAHTYTSDSTYDVWSAIVRGAVLSKLPQEASVISNVAPKHYGVAGGQVYDAVRDDGESKYLDEYEDVWRCRVMTWYINKGDDLLRSHKIAFPFFISFTVNPSYDEFQIKGELLECASDKALVHPKDGVITKNCTLTTHLSKVPKDLFKKKKCSSDGEEY